MKVLLTSLLNAALAIQLAAARPALSGEAGNLDINGPTQIIKHAPVQARGLPQSYSNVYLPTRLLLIEIALSGTAIPTSISCK